MAFIWTRRIIASIFSLITLSTVYVGIQAWAVDLDYGNGFLVVYYEDLFYVDILDFWWSALDF